MSKRKESLPSPVQLKKNKEGDNESAPATPNTIEEQRRKAKEWFDKEEKKKAEALAGASNAKRSASPVQTPSKKSKPQLTEDDEESVVSTRSLRRRSSIGSVTVTETDNASIKSEASSVRPSRTPAKAKKSELAPIAEEVVVPSSARKAAPRSEPASARKAPAAKPAPVELPSSPVQTTLAVSPKAAPKSPKQITPIQAAPAQRTPTTKPSRAIERHAEVTALVASARAPPGAGDNLNPPNALFVLLGQLYIFIGGVAYYNPAVGFATFIVVNAFANLFLMKGRKD